MEILDAGKEEIDQQEEKRRDKKENQYGEKENVAKIRDGEKSRSQVDGQKEGRDEKVSKIQGQ